MTRDPERRPTVLDFDPKRNGPEPWFVGNGKGLMVAVLTVCAVLIVVRGVSMWWFAQATWHRWSERSATTPGPVAAPPAPPMSVPVVRAAPSERGVPRNGQAAGAVGDEAAWITSEDYPAESIRAEEQGTTTIWWVIGADGRVSDCATSVSSGHPRLDAAACRAITQRARYRPAFGADGRPIATTKSRRVKWVLPAD